MPRLPFSATAISVAAHAAVAVLVLWRGTVWAASSRTEDKDRPAMSWIALPPITSRQAETPPRLAPSVTARTVAPRRVEPVKLDGPRRVAATVLATPLPMPLSDPAVADDRVSGDSGLGSSCGDVREVSAASGADAGPGSGGNADDIFGPTSVLVPATTARAAPDDKGAHDVQFWIRADGRVARIAVSPPIRDSDYRRRVKEAMSSFVFGPVRTPDGHPIDYVYSCVVYL